MEAYCHFYILPAWVLGLWVHSAMGATIHLDTFWRCILPCSVLPVLLSTCRYLRSPPATAVYLPFCDACVSWSVLAMPACHQYRFWVPAVEGPACLPLPACLPACRYHLLPAILPPAWVVTCGGTCLLDFVRYLLFRALGWATDSGLRGYVWVAGMETCQNYYYHRYHRSVNYRAPFYRCFYLRSG